MASSSKSPRDKFAIGWKHLFDQHVRIERHKEFFSARWPEAGGGSRPPAAGRSATSNSGCLAMFSHDRTVACALLPLYLLSLYLVFGVATESPDGR
jgi:hypothetical protein